MTGGLLFMETERPIVINGSYRILNPGHSRLFQLRSEEGPDYKVRVQ
jgi:hypothetical protein